MMTPLFHADPDLSLLALGGGVCLLASLAVVALIGRARVSTGDSRAAWIATVAATAGAGVWATHLIVVEAAVPDLPLRYHLGWTALALAAVVGLTMAGLFIELNGTDVRRRRIGGAVMGLGIGLMHVLGMHAFDLPGDAVWSVAPVVGSLAIAVLSGMATMALVSRFADMRGIAAATALLAAAIVAQQVIALTAIDILPGGGREPGWYSVTQGSLVAASVGAAVAMLVMSLVGLFADGSAQQQLRERNALLDAALSTMPQGLCMFDAAGRVVLWNDRLVGMYGLHDVIRPGLPLRDLLRHRVATGSLAEDPDQFAERALAAAQAGMPLRHIFLLPDGREIAISNEVRPTGGWVSTHEDVTERRRAEKDLHRTRAFLDTIIETVPTTIAVKELPDLRYVLINRAGEAHYGVPRESMLGRTSVEVFPPAAAARIVEQDAELVGTGREAFEDEHPIDTPGRGTRIVTTHRSPVFGEDGRIQYLLTVLNDVTERKQQEARIAHMAHHDPLTNLPNRAAFNEHLQAVMAAAAAAGGRFAVICIDLDRFKEVNDVFGHSVGDALLCEVAQRLALACDGAFLARIGGDEFIVVTPVEAAAAETLAGSALMLTQRLHAAVEGDIEIADHPLRAGLTIGVALYPADGGDLATLLSNADAALYRAKTEARGSIRFFEPDMDERLRSRRALQHDLRIAVAGEQLDVHYQPLASIDGDITGFEALVRWRHPDGQQIPPGTFIPLAEESGLIIALGEWILRTACREAASWPKPLQIAVNLSPVQFQHGDLAKLIHEVLLETGLKPSRLELEITESVLVGDFSRAVSILRRLKALGVRVAMDDFGTGYSSLSYLQSFPFDKIKIDQTFISNVERNPQSAAIIRAVLGLGRGLDLPVVAEGVETRGQLEFLARESCQQIQGYLIGRPAPIQDYAGVVGRLVAAPATARAG